MNKNLENIQVFLCSSGTGKSYLAKHNKNFVDMDIIKTKCHYNLSSELKDDEIESLKSSGNLEINKNYPLNYLNVITAYLKEGKKLLLVPSKLELDYLKENKVDFCLIFPSPDCEEEYFKRFLKRGNSEKFSKEVSARISRFYEENLKIDAKFKIILKKGEFLTDILN